ncbi:unnamed protein product [Orchesella dallaii]|uniref:Uncharacterized protein n=1 Tax=Orchesella dallaii TaxID=48710 RepID=A0ABP1S8P8_9HEXA
MSAYVSKKSTLKSFSEWKDPTPYGPNLECDNLKDDWCQREADCPAVFLGSFMSAYVSKKSTLKSFSEWKDPTPYGPNLECDYLKDDWCQREADCTDVFLGSFMSAYVSKKSTLKSFSECRNPTPDGPNLEFNYLKGDLS